MHVCYRDDYRPDSFPVDPDLSIYLLSRGGPLIGRAELFDTCSGEFIVSALVAERVTGMWMISGWVLAGCLANASCSRWYCERVMTRGPDDGGTTLASGGLV